MLTKTERTAGWRARQTLMDAGLDAVAELADAVRRGRPPKSSPEMIAAQKEIGETRAEHEAALKVLHRVVADGDSKARSRELHEVGKRLEIAEARMNEALEASMRARIEWTGGTQWRQIADGLLAGARPTIRAGLQIILPACATSAEAAVLTAIAGRLGVGDLAPAAADARVVLAAVTALGQALDELLTVGIDAGAAWARGWQAMPSAMLREAVQ